MDQSPNLIVVVRPDHFGFNSETASSNSFQNEGSQDGNIIRLNALEEFELFLEILRKNKIAYKAFASPDAQTPDAVFPNNWFSTHHDGSVVIYPMMAYNRRQERNSSIINWLKDEMKFKTIIDLSENENSGLFLEGTGSIVFHHPSQTAFACISSRTAESLLNQLCTRLNYTPCVFHATGLKGEDIYHTNVVMNIGSDYAVLCCDAIENTLERSFITGKLESLGLELITISIRQMTSFAGNMFEVIDTDGKRKLLMSETAYKSLNTAQLDKISKYAEPVTVPVPTIEYYGGGSIRCMVAGIFEPGP